VFKETAQQMHKTSAPEGLPFNEIQI